MDLRLINHKIIFSFIIVAMSATLMAYVITTRPFLKDKFNLTLPVNKPTTQPTTITMPGQISLTTDKLSSTKNKLVLIAMGNSKNESITTFDIDIRYNHDKLTKDKIENLIAGFDIIPTDVVLEDSDQSELIITGIKSQYNNETVYFKDRQLVKITFIVNQPVTQDDIELFFETGQTYDSNLININSQDILGSVTNPNFSL